MPRFWTAGRRALWARSGSWTTTSSTGSRRLRWLERPASVVKGWWRTPDAGARRVGISVVSGGKHAIRVEDDGSGMDPRRPRTWPWRAATSKLTAPGRPGDVAPWGFGGRRSPHRGREPAAAAHRGRRTARAPRSRCAAADRGVRPLARARGTAVGGEPVFQRPRAPKFLRAEATEFAHVARFTTRWR